MLIKKAANVITGDNPPYTRADFLQMYPNFDTIPEVVLQTFIDLAQSSIKEARYGPSWRLCIGLFIAHFCALWQQNMNLDPSDDGVMRSSLVASESAGDVSISYDNSLLNQDLIGWAGWKLTTYGQQFASLAKIAGMGNSYVW